MRSVRTRTGTASAKKNGINTKAGRTIVVALRSIPASAKSRSTPPCAARMRITIAAVATKAVQSSVTTRAPK